MDYTKVLFVGDTPSKHNTDPDVAFKGSRSGKVLEEWAVVIGVNGSYVAINRTAPSFKEAVESWVEQGVPIVALGKRASLSLKQLGVEYFELPHPSGRNRVLNNKSLLEKNLKRCASYVRYCRGAFLGQTHTGI